MHLVPHHFPSQPVWDQGMWKTPLSQCAPWDLAGSGHYFASVLAVEVLTLIQEDMRVHCNAGDLTVYLRALLAVGSSWPGVVGLPGVMVSFPFAWFVIQSALFANNLIPSLLLPFTFHAKRRPVCHFLKVFSLLIFPR